MKLWLITVWKIKENEAFRIVKNLALAKLKPETIDLLSKALTTSPWSEVEKGKIGFIEAEKKKFDCQFQICIAKLSQILGKAFCIIDRYMYSELHKWSHLNNSHFPTTASFHYLQSAVLLYFQSLHSGHLHTTASFMLSHGWLL